MTYNSFIKLIADLYSESKILSIKYRKARFLHHESCAQFASNQSFKVYNVRKKRSSNYESFNFNENEDSNSRSAFCSSTGTFISMPQHLMHGYMDNLNLYDITVTDPFITSL